MLRGLVVCWCKIKKDISIVEHANPKALITVYSGQLNQTTIAQGFGKKINGDGHGEINFKVQNLS